MEFIKKSTNIFPWQYLALLCSYLLNNLLIANSALHWPALKQPPQCHMSQKVICIFKCSQANMEGAYTITGLDWWTRLDLTGLD